MKYFFLEKPDIIISATWQNAVGLLPLKKIIDFQLITFAHGRDVAKIDSINLNTCANVIKNCFIIFAVSNFLKDMIEYRTNLSSVNNVRVLANGANSKLFYPQEPSLQFYEEFKINKSSTLVVSVGRLIPIKEYETIIHAISKLKSQNKNIELAIIGPYNKDSDYYIFLNNLITQLGITERVKLIDSQPSQKLREFYNAADLYVQSSGRDPKNKQEEGLSMTVIEAQFCGAPVVVTRSGGMPGAVAPDLGQIIEIGDVDSLAEIITDVANNPKKYNEIGIKSAEYMRKKFSWEIIINKFLENIGEK